MASKIPPVKNSAFTFRAPLFAQSDGAIQDTPTLAAGDFKVSIDGGAFANLDTLPSEEQTGMVEIALTAAEMNGDEIFVKAVDAAGAEWKDTAWTIFTAAQSHDTTDGVVDTILADTNELQSDDVPTLIAALPTAAENRTEMDSNSTQLAAIVADTNELQSDDIPAAIAALPTAAEINTEVDTALADYDAPTKAELDSGLAALNDPTAAAIRTEIDSNSTQLAAIVADTNELQTDDVPGLIAALNDLSAADVNTQVDAAFTTQIADSVPADGTLPTREQAIYMLTQFLLERSVSGTTVTVKKVDGSTTLMTFTLNDGTSPTSITRAS